MYLDPEFQKSYQTKTGKSLSSSVVTDADFAKLSAETGSQGSGEAKKWHTLDFNGAVQAAQPGSGSSASATPAGSSTPGATASLPATQTPSWQGIDYDAAFRALEKQQAGTTGTGAAAASAAPGPTQGLGLGYGLPTTDAQNDANEVRLRDPGFVQSEIARAKDVIAARRAGGLDTSAQDAYLQRISAAGFNASSTPPAAASAAPGPTYKDFLAVGTAAKTGDVTATAQALVNMGIPPAEAVQMVQAYQQAGGQLGGNASPQQPGAADVTAPLAPKAPAGRPQPLSFADWLRTQGLNLPTIPQYQFDPGEAYRSSLAQAELAAAPQRQALQGQYARRTADKTKEGLALLRRLRESQAQRRLFSSPVGLYTEQEQEKANQASLNDLGAEEADKLTGLESEKALRATAGMNEARRQSYDQWQGAARMGQDQFGNMVQLWDASQNHELGRDKLSAEMTHWLNQDVNARGQLGVSQGNLAVSQGNLALSKAKAEQDVLKDADAAARGWATIRNENAVKFGIVAGNLYNQAMDAAMLGDEETAQALMQRAAQQVATDTDAKEGRAAAREMQRTLMGVFGSVAGKYGSQVAAWMVAGLQSKDGKEADTFFKMADRGIEQVDGRRAGQQTARAMAVAEYNAGQAAARQRESARQAYALKFGPEAGAQMAYADELESANYADEADSVRAKAGAAAQAWMAKGNESKKDSASWKGFMNDLDQLEKSAVYDPQLKRSLPSAVGALVQKWVPAMNDQEAEALEAYLKARGWQR